MYVRFEAETNDIEKFINNSPSIDTNNVRIVGPLLESEEAPTWWPTDDSSGRMYVFELYEREYITGMVRVYDDSNTIRIGVRYIVNPQLQKINDFIERIYDDPGAFLEDLLEDLYHEVLDLFD